MIDSLLNIDESLFLFLHHLFRGPVADSFMWMVSDKWVWVPMYFVILLSIIKKYGLARSWVVIACIILATVFADQTCASLIRPLFERMRPAHPDNPLSQFVLTVNGYRGGAYGFPSCHAANTFMLATFIGLITRSRQVSVWMYFWALANCVSRIYLGVHYPGDLIFGALIGIIFALLMNLLALKILKFTTPKDSFTENSTPRPSNNDDTINHVLIKIPRNLGPLHIIVFTGMTTLLLLWLLSL